MSQQVLALFRRSQSVFFPSLMGSAERNALEKAILYGGQRIKVSQEVADFLESDRRRQAAQDRSDRRHLSKSSFETMSLLHNVSEQYSLDDVVIDRLMCLRLREIINELKSDEKELLRLYFYDEQTMEEIGKHFGISKAAVSKRIKKLVRKMRGLLE